MLWQSAPHSLSLSSPLLHLLLARLPPTPLSVASFAILSRLGLTINILYGTVHVGKMYF